MPFAPRRLFLSDLQKHVAHPRISIIYEQHGKVSRNFSNFSTEGRRTAQRCVLGFFAIFFELNVSPSKGEIMAGLDGRRLQNFGRPKPATPDFDVRALVPVYRGQVYLAQFRAANIREAVSALVEVAQSEDAPAHWVTDAQGVQHCRLGVCGVHFLRAVATATRCAGLPMRPASFLVLDLALRACSDFSEFQRVDSAIARYGDFGSWNFLVRAVDNFRGLYNCKNFADRWRKENRFLVSARRSFRDYVDTLFSANHSINAVRLHLFLPPHAWKIGFQGAPELFDEICKARARLVNCHDQNRIFKGEVGWLMKVQFDYIAGFYLDAFWFFDRCVQRNDIVASMAIGRYWREEITGWRGGFFSWNHAATSMKRSSDPVNFESLGIIRRSDLTKRNYLWDAVENMLMDGLFARVLIGSGRRIFFRGEIQKGK